MLSALHFSGWSLIHPDDKEKVQQAIIRAMPEKTSFTLFIRLLHHPDGHSIPVRIKGCFADELHENRYPLFYAVVTDLSDVKPETE